MHRLIGCFAILLMLSAVAVEAKQVAKCVCPELSREDPSKYWKLPELEQVPEYRECPYAESQADGLRSLLVRGYSIDQKGKVSEFFAFYGVPSGTKPAGGWPAVLLAHGGGGTAFAEVARLWMSRGYAVLVVDWLGNRPLSSADKVKGGTTSGKSVSISGEPEVGNDERDHVAVVKNLVLMHSLLRSMPEVDPAKTLYVGLSWGSAYGACVGAVDSRFCGVVEIYCGLRSFGCAAHSPIPSAYPLLNGQFLHAAKVPYYWICGTNDLHAEPDEIAATFAEVPELANKTLVVKLPHGHCGFRFEACQRMAAHFLKGEPNLPKFGEPRLDGRVLRAKIVDNGKGITSARLSYVCEVAGVKSHLQEWKVANAGVSGDEVVVEVPAGATRAFLSAYEGESAFHELCGSTTIVTFPSLCEVDAK